MSQEPLSSWSDEDVLTAADSHLSPVHDQRLSELLDRQQEGVLSDAEHHEMATLIQVYQEGMVTKSQALCEAVRRGLRQPLNS